MKRRALLVVLLSIGLGACGIPDLKPFSDATAEMATVLKQGFERARASLGAATETEMKEKKARVEDAMHATKAAVEEGIVPGGGVALLRAGKAIKLDGLEGDERTGAAIIVRALE